MNNLTSKDWRGILSVHEYCKKSNNKVDRLFVVEKNETFICLDHHTSKNPVIYELIVGLVSPKLINVHHSIGTHRQKEIEYYLYFALLPQVALLKSECQIVAHFAQSLDGHIATADFDSQWIGNEDNLLHAHRMRALSDGIMVGAQTVIKDNPRLTVRLVEGNNPEKFVFISQNKNIDNFEMKGFSVICSDPSYTNPVDFHIIKKFLYNMKIRTLYLEGGSKTTSLFLDYGLIDVLQLHIAPILIGGGIPTLQLSPIKDLSQATTFAHRQFIDMDDHIMFEGRGVIKSNAT